MGSLREGSRVPPFTAQATGSTRVDSEDLLGAPLVLFFYPRDRSPGCTVEGIGFGNRHARFALHGTTVFGVSRDSMKSHEKFKAMYGFPFELIADADAKLCQLFGVIKQRSILGRKFFGIERSTFLIDADGILRREWRKVKIRDHADNVLEAVDAL